MSKDKFFSEVPSPELDERVLQQAMLELEFHRQQKRRESIQIFWRSFAGLALASGVLTWFWRLQRTKNRDDGHSATLFSFMSLEAEVFEESLILSEVGLDQMMGAQVDEVLEDFDLLVEMTEADWERALSDTDKESS